MHRRRAAAEIPQVSPKRNTSLANRQLQFNTFPGSHVHAGIGVAAATDLISHSFENGKRIRVDIPVTLVLVLNLVE
jgi:hypothetical protein